MQTSPFSRLAFLAKHSDDVFQRFYEELLSNKVFAKHFGDDDQIKSLLVRQKNNFTDSLQESTDELAQRYYRVGVVHFDHDIPFEVLQSGTRLLRETFKKTIYDTQGDTELSLINDAMFDFISEAMAKGYLDRFLSNEKSDLVKILSMAENATFGMEKRLLVKHYNWMLQLLSAVDQKDYAALDGLLSGQKDDSDTLYAYIEEHISEIEATIQLEELDRIRFRIVANTENIFFYLKREAYSEVLSLIINILEIYKMTLVLENVVSSIIVKKAETVINEKVKLSETDPLTNVMNRRKFEELLENLLHRAHHTGQPLSIMVLDIDNFKLVNDHHGHQAGDQVLVDLARLIDGCIRKHDYLIRYGGEEFVIISEDSELDQARQLAEKIRRDVASHAFNVVGQVTVSLGVAELQDEDDCLSLFERADHQLYHAKSEGKNCICY